jgi:diphthine synthase
MLTFVGLGLYDERSITVEGREAVREADRAFAEVYTSRLAGATVDDLEAYHGVDIDVRDREAVESAPEPILDAAASDDVVFLTAGDPMVSTTHVDLRLRAHDRGVDTRVVHGTSAATAAASLSGLQNYRFGKATTLPFPWAHGASEAVPPSVVETVTDNRDRGLHTLVYLDIEVEDGRVERARSADERGDERFLTADNAAGLLAEPLDDPLAVAVCRAGSPDPVVAADRCSALAGRSLGPPLHLLVVPGSLHHVERDALRALAGVPETALGAVE